MNILLLMQQMKAAHCGSFMNCLLSFWKKAKKKGNKNLMLLSQILTKFMVICGAHLALQLFEKWVC